MNQIFLALAFAVCFGSLLRAGEIDNPRLTSARDITMRLAVNTDSYREKFFEGLCPIEEADTDFATCQVLNNKGWNVGSLNIVLENLPLDRAAFILNNCSKWDERQIAAECVVYFQGGVNEAGLVFMTEFEMADGPAK